MVRPTLLRRLTLGVVVIGIGALGVSTPAGAAGRGTPVPTEAVDNPARQPYRSAVTINLADSAGDVAGSLTPVPAGKRLVAETVFAFVRVGSGQKPLLLLELGSLAPIPLTLHDTLTTIDGNVDIYLAAHPVRVYVSEGPFSVRGLPGSVVGSASFQITVEGHLVDVD